MKDISFFKRCKDFFTKNKVHLVKDVKYDFENMILNMGDKEEIVIDGIGTVCYVKNNTPLPYLLFIPENVDDTERLIVEANNCESDNEESLIRQAVEPLKKFGNLLDKKVPVLVPIIPSFANRPYYQQLSRDMFYEKDVLRMEEKFNDTIKEALARIEKASGKHLDSKVFLNGYSSSGVFAQRFAIFHPEMIDTLCVGGASGSIPIPTTEMPYPLGVEGITPFDAMSYSKIKFRYYVGEYETINMAHYDEKHRENARKDIIDGHDVKVEAPMHDMTYFPRSVPVDVGKKYRDKYGVDYFQRVENVSTLYKNRGFDFDSIIIKKRAHKDLVVNGKKYEGIKDKADDYIKKAYEESTLSLKEKETKTK